MPRRGVWVVCFLTLTFSAPSPAGFDVEAESPGLEDRCVVVGATVTVRSGPWPVSPPPSIVTARRPVSARKTGGYQRLGGSRTCGRLGGSWRRAEPTHFDDWLGGMGEKTGQGTQYEDEGIGGGEQTLEGRVGWPVGEMG